MKDVTHKMEELMISAHKGAMLRTTKILHCTALSEAWVWCATTGRNKTVNFSWTSKFVDYITSHISQVYLSHWTTFGTDNTIDHLLFLSSLNAFVISHHYFQYFIKTFISLLFIWTSPLIFNPDSLKFIQHFKECSWRFDSSRLQ